MDGVTSAGPPLNLQEVNAGLFVSFVQLDLQRGEKAVECWKWVNWCQHAGQLLMWYFQVFKSKSLHVVHRLKRVALIILCSGLRHVVSVIQGSTCVCLGIVPISACAWNLLVLIKMILFKIPDKGQTLHFVKCKKVYSLKLLLIPIKSHGNSWSLIPLF